MKQFMFTVPSRILFGEKMVQKLPLFVKEFNSERTFVVSDVTLRKIGLVDQVLQPLKSIGVELTLFDNVEPEPSILNAEEVAAAVRSGHFDLVIGIGGGSVLDMAKVASAAAVNPGTVRSYIGVDKIPRRGLPMILVPTTSGTGSEITMNAVVKSEEDLIKLGIVSKHLLPDVAVIDPTLTLTMPPKITASCGLDALSHAVESLMSVNSNPITEALAIAAARLVFSSLKPAYEKGNNIEARRNMALASTMAGMAFGNTGVCAGHAVAYAFAVKSKCPHGVSCAIALPYVIEFNMPNSLRVLSMLAKAVGVQGRTPERDAYNVVRAVRKLITDVNIPLSLEKIGLTENDIPRLAEDLLKSQRLLVNNPRPISREDAEGLFARMLKGRPLPYSTYVNVN
ncbi:MAG: iron-containing alcohol dehydrogenase [Candidatus Bathyarchaeia archaeon]